jgi:hypothetical protein
MKIVKASFDKKIGMPNFSNDTPGVVEVILEDGDTIESVWTELNQRAIAWHRAEYPHLYQEGNKPEWVNMPVKANTQMIEMREVPTISKDAEKLEIAIDNAQSIGELQGIKDDCWKHGLTVNYINKFNELNNGRPFDFTEGLDKSK